MPYKISKHHFFRIFLPAVILLILIVLLCFAKNTYSVFEIINTHEHIESVKKADELVLAMDNLGIKKTVLIPSPAETITLSGNNSFTRYDENVDEILKISQKYPDRFIPFCTISPLDDKAQEKFRDCHERGGKGLKLYNGHSLYYGIFGIPLDSEIMDPVYAYAEQERLPVLYHVNIANYGAELENILKKYPDLVVSIPHFMVSSIELQRVEHILDNYPNTYTDISFGYEPYFASGFRRMSKNIKKYKDFFEKYPDRILYGADMVLTEIEKKDQKYMEITLQCYKDILEKKAFRCEPVKDHYKNESEKNLKIYEDCNPKSGDFCKSKKEKMESFTRWYNEVKKLNGLNLNSGILKMIYEDNPKRFLNGNT